MTRVTVFGAGAMGTAVAMHLARCGNETMLWASPFDERVLAVLRESRRHPNLPEHLPDSLSVFGPAELAAAAKDIHIAVIGAHSGGARALARMVAQGTEGLPLTVGVAKGLEPGTGKRMSEVYREEVGHDRVVSMGGPGLAPELAQDLPTATLFASSERANAEDAAGCFRSPTYQAHATDDLVGVEYCTVAKNVAAIGMGIVDGMAKVSGLEYRNAKAALFTIAFGELMELVLALGGRPETVMGLAGLGDTLVTALGGRNRLYGELIGEGAEPRRALRELMDRGMTVEGVDSTVDVKRLAEEHGQVLPFFERIHAILFDRVPADCLMECLKG